MKRYVTFGQDHAHFIQGKHLDKDCVAVIEGTREDVFKLFGPKFCFEYPEDHWKESNLEFFPRGYIHLSTSPEKKEA